MDNENEMLAEVLRLREAFRSNNLRLEDCKAQFEVIRGLAGRLTDLLDNERQQQKEEGVSRDALSSALSEEKGKLAAAKIKTTVKEILDTGDQAAARSALAIKEMNEALSSESSLPSVSEIEFIKLRRQRRALSDSLEKAKVSAGENEVSLMNALAEQERALNEAFAAGKEAALQEARDAAGQESSRSAAAHEELRASLDAERQKASALEARQLELSRQVEELSARVDQMKFSSAEKEASLNEALAAAEQDLSRSAAITEELGAALKAESVKAAALADEREGLRLQAEALAAQLKQAKTSAAEKDALLAAARAEAEAGTGEKALAALREESDSRVTAATAERDGLQARLEALTKRLEAAEAAAAGKEAALQEACAAAERENLRFTAIAEELRASLNAESANSDALAAEREGLRLQAEALATRLEEAKASAAGKEALLMDASAEAEAKAAAVVPSPQYAEKIAALTAERDGLLATLETLGKRLEVAEAAAAEKEAALKEARADAGEDPSLSAAAFEELRASLDAESEKTKALEMEREGLSVRIQSLTVLAEETGKALAGKEELQNKTEELAGVIAELRAALSKNNEKLSQALSERDKMQARLRAAPVPAPPGTPCGWVRSLFSRKKQP